VTDAVNGIIEYNYIYDLNTGIPQLLVEMDSAGLKGLGAAKNIAGFNSTESKIINE